MQTVQQSSRDSPSHNLSCLNEGQKRYQQLQDQQSNTLMAHSYPRLPIPATISGNDLSEYSGTTWDINSHLFYHQPMIPGTTHSAIYHVGASGGLTTTSNGCLITSSSRLPVQTVSHAQQAVGSSAGVHTVMSNAVTSQPHHVIALGHGHHHHHHGPSHHHTTGYITSQSTHHHHHHHKRHNTNSSQATSQNTLQLTRSPGGSATFSYSGLFCDVWQNNFMEGIRLLRYLSTVYTYVAVDTEFPGIVAKVNQDYMDASEQAYQNIRINLNMLKPIQIGFSFMNEGAATQENHCTTVQFNMRWDLAGDTHAIDSIRLLEESGIEFQRLKTEGILADEFAAELIGTGAVLNAQLKHIGYHSAYDWAYLLKLLTGWTELPDLYAEYHDMLKHYFPHISDVKVYQANLSHLPKGGLQELADSYGIARYGAQHQAGSDARLTGEVFFKILQDERLSRKQELHNLIFGLNYGQGTNLWVPAQQLGVQENENSSASINGIKIGKNGIVAQRVQEGAESGIGTIRPSDAMNVLSSSDRDDDSASSCGSTCSSNCVEGVEPNGHSLYLQQHTRPESTLSSSSAVTDGPTGVVY